MQTAVHTVGVAHHEELQLTLDQENWASGH